MRSTPRPIGVPLGLVVQVRGRSAAEGKLASHSRRESEMARGSLAMRNPVRSSARSSDGNGGSVAGTEGPCAEVEGPAPPPGAPRDLGTMGGASKTELLESSPGCRIGEPW